jgi:hypothetical protein
MDTHSTPLIFNLLNELLHKIISFLPGDGKFLHQTLDGKQKWAIQMLVIMSSITTISNDCPRSQVLDLQIL